MREWGCVWRCNSEFHTSGAEAPRAGRQNPPYLVHQVSFRKAPNHSYLAMSCEYIDFRLTQDARNTQLLTLAKDPTYPPYHIRIDDNIGDKYLPSLLNDEPDVSISHRTYLAPAFAEATFHKYRNGISIIYPETSLRIPEGDVTTTVDDVSPCTKQDIKCESLGERRYTFGLELGYQRRERCSWRPPTECGDSSHLLELRRQEAQTEEKGEGPLAKILLNHWGAVAEDELIAVVRIRMDLFGEQEEDMRVADRILVTAIVLLERLRRRHRYFTNQNTAVRLFA